MRQEWNEPLLVRETEVPYNRALSCIKAAGRDIGRYRNYIAPYVYAREQLTKWLIDQKPSRLVAMLIEMAFQYCDLDDDFRRLMERNQRQLKLEREIAALSKANAELKDRVATLEMARSQRRLLPRITIPKVIKGVYFVQSSSDRRIKIGQTNVGMHRITNLSSASSAPLRLVGFKQCEDPAEEERELHERFQNFRVHGEWFVPALAIIEYIKTEAA